MRVRMPSKTGSISCSSVLLAFACTCRIRCNRFGVNSDGVRVRSNGFYVRNNGFGFRRNGFDVRTQALSLAPMHYSHSSANVIVSIFFVTLLCFKELIWNCIFGFIYKKCECRRRQVQSLAPVLCSRQPACMYVCVCVCVYVCVCVCVCVCVYLCVVCV
jgi:hypothetical protein